VHGIIVQMPLDTADASIDSHLVRFVFQIRVATCYIDIYVRGAMTNSSTYVQTIPPL
jgi:hypothetical protein